MFILNSARQPHCGVLNARCCWCTKISLVRTFFADLILCDNRYLLMGNWTSNWIPDLQQIQRGGVITLEICSAAIIHDVLSQFRGHNYFLPKFEKLFTNSFSRFQCNSSPFLVELDHLFLCTNLVPLINISVQDVASQNYKCSYGYALNVDNSYISPFIKKWSQQNCFQR